MGSKRNILISLLITFAISGCGSAPTSSFQNVISSSFSSEEIIEYYQTTYTNALIPFYKDGSYCKEEIADPTVVRGDDGKYYCFSTLRRLFVSEDLVTWDHVTSNIIPRPTWGDSEKYGIPEVWAPDCIKIQDKWIYYYSLAAWDKPSAGIGYAVADDIAGPYTDMGKLFNQDDIVMNGLIDPQVFIDYDGRIYMLVGSFHGNYIVELESDGMSLKGGAAYQNEHKTLIAGVPLNYFNNSYYEGGYIIKRGEFYYFFGSAGSCCESKSSSYRVFVGRADNILGPYLAPNGQDLASENYGKTIGKLILSSYQYFNVYGPGHNSIVEDDAGDLWMMYHGYCDFDNYATRHLFMDKIVFEEDYYPMVEFTYTNDKNERKTVKGKPSYGYEIEGPRFRI